MKKVLLVLAIFSISACQGGDVKSIMGITKDAPDEFHVISNPPLSMPPAFNLGEPGEHRPFLAPENDCTEDSLDKNEARFLSEIAADSHKTKEMMIIDDEYKSRQKKYEGSGVKKAMHYLKGNDDAVIDPIKERERIIGNSADGKLINEGDIAEKKKSTLGRIFSN